MSKTFRNPIVHDTNKSVFPSPYSLTEEALKNYNIDREKFGSTEILLPNGSSYIVKDYQYQLEDGQVGMFFIPINDHGTVVNLKKEEVAGDALIDVYLRTKMGLKEDEPIFALLNYFHPEQNKGTIQFLTTESDKIEMGFTHLGAYYGKGYTTNAPMLYHNNRFGVNGDANQTVFGYPANVQIISLKDVPQGTLNKNLRYVDTILNFGIMFPKNYKESMFRPIDINTALMFYRDWIKFEGYLRNDDTWFTYCAAHKTLVTTVALNLPHNLASFQEVYGEVDGKDLFTRFIKLYSNIIGPDPGFLPVDETNFEPLWKKEGFAPNQISPFTYDEYYAYDEARRAGNLGTYTGKKALLPNQAMCWAPQTSAEIIYNFIETYAETLDAGAIMTSAIILGYMKEIDERMGINDLQYLLNAMPIIEKLMLSDAKTHAKNDPTNYLANTYQGLYLAFGGKNEPATSLKDEVVKIKGFKLNEDSVEEFIQANPIPEALAAWSLIDVVDQWETIINEQPLSSQEAYEQMMASIQADIEKAREILVTEPNKIEFNTPPAITHLICNAMYHSHDLVTVREVCTIVDHTEIQLTDSLKSVTKNLLNNDPELIGLNNPDLTPEMKELILELTEIVKNPMVESAYNDAIANVQPILLDGSENPWLGKNIDYFVNYFIDWFTFIPLPSGGLGKIVPFTYFYLNNRKAYYFINQFQSRRNDSLPYSKEIFDWNVKFIKVHGKFMDSPESLKYIQQWLEDPSTNIQDFIEPEGGFKSFNDFFTRKLNYSVNPRPISFPNDDSVLVASADSEINFIESDLTLTTNLQVKTRQINVKDLLNNSKFASQFVGGTAISCVLMPNNYHRYHAPVTGKIVESQEVPGIYNGIIDGEHWFNKWNVGESSTDFSIFEDFHRAYFIIETEKHGYVAMIPVGLNTISGIFSSLVNDESSMVPPGAPPVSVQKGDELGHFAYGGSLNILLFQPGVFSSMSVLMGQRLGSLSPIG